MRARLGSTRAAALGRRGRSGLLWGLVSGLVAAAIVVGALWFAPFLRVEQVDYRTDATRIAALKKAAPVVRGRPLVEVDTSAIRGDVLATRLFETANVTRSWPSTLVIEASPRVPVVAVKAPGVAGVRLVGRDGVAFETVSSPPRGVPVASAPSTDDAGAMRALAAVITGLEADLRGKTTDLQVDAAGRITMRIDDIHVTWGDATDSRLKAAVVRDLVGREGVARIDVSSPLAPVTSSESGPATPWSPGATESGSAGTRGPRTASSALHQRRYSGN